MITGRPTKINKAKNRVHSVVLTESAEIVYRSICSKTKSKKWFYKFVSNKIVEEFAQNDESIHLEELNDLQTQINDIKIKILAKDEIIKNLRQEKPLKRKIKSWLIGV